MFKNDPDLRKHTLIAVVNSSTDGASGIGKRGANSQTDALRKSIYYFADIIFSAQPSDRKYFLGEGDDVQKVIDLYGSLMPCIHGSDAHELDKIFEPDQKRYCWIKADTTFEGLLQILYEPAERVLIQENKPDDKDAHQLIESIIFEDSNFRKAPIVFNESLTPCRVEGENREAFKEKSAGNAPDLHGTEGKRPWISGRRKLQKLRRQEGYRYT